MYPSVFSSRVAKLVLVSFLAGCAAIDGMNGSSTSSTSEVTPEIVALDTTPLTSRTILAAKKNQAGIELVKTRSGDQIVIGNNLSESAVSVKRYHAPERVVIDLPSKGALFATKNFETTDSDLVSKIRVGSHPGQSRIVLDLSPSVEVRDSAEFRDGSLIVALHNPNAVQAQAAEVASAESIETAPPAPVAALPEADIPVIDTTTKAEPIQRAQAAVEEAPRARPVLETVAANPDEEIKRVAMLERREAELRRPQLKSLSIAHTADGGNMVVAEVSGAASYTLTRSAISEYVLLLKRTTMDMAAAEALVAPPGDGIVRSVRAVVKGEDLLLRVFVTPEATLGVRADGSRVLLGQFGARARDDMRAEVSPEAVAEAAKEAEKKSDKKVEVTKTDVAKNGTEKVETKEVDPSIASLLDDAGKYHGRLISLDLQETDIDNALRIIAEVSNLNIIASEDVTGKLTLRLIDVPWDQALDVILKTNGLDKVQEGNVIRIAPVEKLRQEREQLKQAIVAEKELEPLQVEYIRVSYAKAADIKSLVESVLTERGSVAYDERTNQLIVKDIRDGIKNVGKLISKIDLRTPQILLETQIVEANRNFIRDLGSELNFDFRMTPATGNATGMNFPNSIIIGGAGSAAIGGNASAFPAAIDARTGGSAVQIALASADGTKSLKALLTALETEGKARIVSRPSVATTNNKQAQIKSTNKIRVKLPQGGLSVATGAGANAGGGGSTATETIEVGITLDVTPQASPDYYVLLDIAAKSSNLGTIQVDGIPNELERSATSTVLVSSGQTFAMGGIYKTTENDSNSGVPFLRDVPVLGTFFRRSFYTGTDEELMFFITPRIIEGSFDDAAMRAVS